MKEIVVPAPPKEAFNKHRRMSDLIKKQVEHFKHLEHKLAPEHRAVLPQHAITTEGEAAQYIAAITRLIKSKAEAPAPKLVRLRKVAQPAQGIALAASEDREANSEKIARTARARHSDDDAEANSEKISPKATSSSRKRKRKE